MPEPLKRGACSHLYFFLFSQHAFKIALFSYLPAIQSWPFLCMQIYFNSYMFEWNGFGEKRDMHLLHQEGPFVDYKVYCCKFYNQEQIEFFALSLSLLCESKFTLNNKLFIIFSFSRITHSFGRMQTYKSEFLILFSLIFGEIVGAVWEFFMLVVIY